MFTLKKMSDKCNLFITKTLPLFRHFLFLQNSLKKNLINVAVLSILSLFAIYINSIYSLVKSKHLKTFRQYCHHFTPFQSKKADTETFYEKLENIYTVNPTKKSKDVYFIISSYAHCRSWSAIIANICANAA